ncbi:MAG: potassium transporter TrkA [Bacteroidetes bacterium]|jgi:Trk K+ transport system NAD-binding subunit|nr:potassium transporter TrkA [Bacteroidota bacterium]
MKTLSTQLSYFLQNKEIRQNLPILLKYIGVLVAVIVAFTVLFHFIMLYAEGREHSWITGLYWTLTVMSTLGFGDITFQTDIGRLFSVIVLITGIVMLLIVLPFAFIRFFYAPWLEAQIHSRAPRELPETTEGHVLMTARDAIAPGLITRLERDGIPYALIESDPAVASAWHTEGLSVVVGEVDNQETFRNLRADQARLVVANRDDIINTNIALTVREAAPAVPIAAVADNEDAVDILELSGATHVLPLKRWLGEQLSNRINALRAGLHPIGEYEDLKIAELPVHNTPLAGHTVRETRLREKTGVSIIGVWKRGRLQAARPDTMLTDQCVPVVLGTDEQLDELDAILAIYDVNPNPVLLIGGGMVGSAAARALATKDVPVHLVERKRERCRQLRGTVDNVFHGDASDYSLLHEAGIDKAPSVLLTTNDDAVNVYLASYCRRLNPELRIVSRITHERNLDAIYRAGADFVLSYSTLGLDAIMSILNDRKLVVLGEGVDLFARPLPDSLQGHTLAESGIGAQTGLNVVAVKRHGSIVTRLTPDLQLQAGDELVMVGAGEQVDAFVDAYR